MLFNFLLLNLTLQQKDAWKSELKDFSNKTGYDINRNGDSGPLLLDVLEGFMVCYSFLSPLNLATFNNFVFISAKIDDIIFQRLK